jgi:hypothetical protein
MMSVAEPEKLPFPQARGPHPYSARAATAETPQVFPADTQGRSAVDRDFMAPYVPSSRSERSVWSLVQHEESTRGQELPVALPELSAGYRCAVHRGCADDTFGIVGVFR